MKTKLILLVATIAISGMTGVSNASDQRMIYNGKGQLIAVVSDSSDIHSARTDSGPVNYAPSFHNKGGVVVMPSRESTTSIALFKSKKAANCDTAACCAKH